MFSQILGNLDKKPIDLALGKAKKLIKIPTNLTIYFLEKIDLCYSINLPKNIQNNFKLSCDNKVSFSFKFKKRKIIVVYPGKDLLKKQDALIGLLLHEISHINHIDKGIYKQIYSSYNARYNKNFNLFRSLNYNKNELSKLFQEISLITILTLKDIYTNNELISKKLTNYLLAYYKIEFNRKICPKPVFYKNIKSFAKKDLNIVKNVFEFELALLSVILPLYKTKKADYLIKFIENCYEINIQDISEKCHELIRLYFAEFGKKEFNKEFIDLVFLKVYNLLK